MSLQWPLLTLLALLVPLVLGAYVWKIRKRRSQAVRYSSVALLRTVMPKPSNARRHLPVAFLLSSIGVLALASARPQIMRDVPSERTSIILALDVSQSMCATDVQPNRLSVAQQAARAFVEQQADGARMGIVVFSGSAQLIVAPTADREVLRRAIDGLTTARGTAIGAAIVKGLEAIAEVNPSVEPVGEPPTGDVSKPGANGFAADVIVLLTDGANTRGIAPLDAVPYAVERGVRVFTIGFGTTQPASLSCTRAQLGAAALDPQGAFGGGRASGAGGRVGSGAFGGAGSPLVADEKTLRAVAEGTGGRYYRAEDAPQLRDVFADLPKNIDVQKEEREITAWFAALGAALAAVAMAASIKWSAFP